MKMHDELMSSMDISSKMLELTACAILPIDSDNKLIDINISNDRLISIDNQINNENNDTNDSNSNESVINDSEESIRGLVNEYVDEVINENSIHFCDRITNDLIDDKFSINDNKSPNNVIVENGKFGEEEYMRTADEEVEEEPNSLTIDVKFDENDSVVVLKSGLKVINGCVEPPFDPPIDKKLRFTNQLQFLRVIMTKYLCRYKTALPFLKPVDCIKLKIPDYYNVITNPMDLTTIKRRLMFLWYSTADECLQDFRLIFNNCFQFNCSDDFVYKAGKKLEEYLNEKLKDMPTEELEIIPLPSKPNIVDIEKQIVKRKAESTTEEMSDAVIARLIADNNSRQRSGKKMITRSEHGLQVKKPNKDLPTPIASPPQPPPKRVPLNTSMKFCLELVKEMFVKKHREYAWPFYEPVSTQLYPDYLKIVKKPMDLTTIKTNIETGQYKSVKPFVKDMRLMFTNCLRYNKPEAPVIEQARKLRDLFEYRFAKIPEELLNEKMPTINTISNQNNSSADQQNSHKTKETDVLTTNGTENQQRMTILETQVKLLTNAMSALTGVKTKNGVKKQKVITQSSTGRKRKRNSNNTPQKQRKVRKSVKKESPLKKKSKLSDNAVVDEDDDNSNSSLVPSPIAFTYNDMEDLKLLKSDLENLDAKDLKSVLRILQTTEPSIRCDNDENIEIDFEILKPETLIALRKFVSSCMLNNKPKKSKSSVNGSDSSKKSANCDMTNDFSFKSDSYLYPSSARLSESSSDSESESSSDSESSDNNED